MSDDDIPTDLRRALAGLADLSVESYALTDVLTRVATFAVQAIPNADGAGLTLQHDTRDDVIVASDRFVSEADEIQYRVGEGPCITAAATGTTIRSGSLGDETRWPQFSHTVGKLGVHSVLSLPLIVAGDTVIGAMNVYARSTNAFDDDAARIGERFALPAAVSVQNARALADAVHLARELDKALRTRSTVGQAIGIVMSRFGCGPSEALEKLRDIGRRENRDLDDISAALVDDATGHARSRTTDRSGAPDRGRSAP